MRMDRRIRLLGRILGRTSIATRSDEEIVAFQQRGVPRNRLTEWLSGTLAAGVMTKDITVAGAEGDLPARVYRPRRSAGELPLVVFYHGGGWMTGDLDSYDWVTSHVAARADVVVVSVAYRLAPTHRWPVAAEDAYAACVDVVARAGEWAADGRRVAVAGDSAGGNLSAVVTLMARDRGGPPITFQGLIYPATDLTAAIDENDVLANAPILPQRDRLAYGTAYIPNSEDRRHPHASPALAADHTGLPPALVQVAEHDPLREDGLRYADILRAAGVPVRTTDYVGMPHGFLSFPNVCRSAPQAVAELSDQLREHLHGAAKAMGA